MAKVSVIIPTSNRFVTLQRAIQSVANQVYKDWELIVVDDASSDETHLIPEKIKLTNLQYYRLNEKSGGAVARNLGIQKATGKYTAFLDDDDEWLPLKLEKQVKIMEKDSLVGICYTGRKIISPQKFTFGFSKTYSFRSPDSSNHFFEIMKDNFIGVTSSVIIPTSILEKLNGFDENLPCFQDYDLYIRILKNWKAAGINEPLVNYYLGSSTGHVSFTRANVEKASKYLLEKYKNEPYIGELKRAIRIINLKKMIKSFSYTKEYFGVKPKE